MRRKKAIQIVYQVVSKTSKVIYVEQLSVEVKCENGFNKCTLDND